MEQSTQDLPAGIERLMLAALPPGWRVLGRCRFGTAGPTSEASGCHALAHPATGIALVDVAPDATPNAEARLRRALSAADFWPDFPGNLPVWHGRIELAEVRLLPGILAEGFSTLPPLTVPGKDAWMDAVQDAIAEDPAWEVPGRAPRVLAPAFIEQDDAPPLRRIGRLVVAVAFVLTFGLGLASGVMLLSGAPPEPPSESLAQPPAVIAALPTPPPPPEPAPPVLPPIERVSLPALPLAVPAEPPPAEAPPPEPTVAAEEPESPAEEELATPPPAPKPPPVRRVSAQPRIDPGCSRALFRFQQGLPLSAAEAAHVRDGCATRR